MINRMIADKVILVDCDGVLCDWLYAFDQWMEMNAEFYPYVTQ